jgi:hypothetical protein
MKFRQLITIAAAALLLGGAALAQTPANILAGLGAKGTTDRIPTNAPSSDIYAGYLILLDETGTIHSSLLPAGEGDPVALNNMIFLDSINGNDTFSGTFQRPFKTFSHAVDEAGTAAVFVFMPGIYSNVNTTVSNMTDMVLLGFDPDMTTLEGMIQLQANNDVTIKVGGMQVYDILQQQYQDLTVHLFDRAVVLNQIERQWDLSPNSVLTLYRDPSATLTWPIATTNSVEILTHNAADVGYTLATADDWWEQTPITVAEALDQLAGRVAMGTNAGEMVVWNGTNWTTLAAGTTNQLLYGGAVPTWQDQIIWPGTNVGQLVYWDGTNWSPVATGTTNQILFGSAVKPEFMTWGDVYDAYDVPYAGSLAEAARIGFTAPTTAGGALDLVISNMVPRGASIGDMARWDGTNWVGVAAGTIEQFLRGGESPEFVDHLLIPPGTTPDDKLVWDGTNWVTQALTLVPLGDTMGDMMRWTGTEWDILPKGSSAEILWGGLVPMFRSPTWWGLSTNAIISSGTNDGQIMYWDTGTDEWAILEPGGSNDVLHSGSVPYWAAGGSGGGGGDASNTTYASSVDYATVEEALDALLYPYVPVSVALSITGGLNYDKGQTLTDVDMTWTANRAMDSRELTGNTNYSFGAGQNGAFTHTNANISATTYYRLTVTDGVSTNYNQDTFVFWDRRYWGEDVAATGVDPLTLSDERASSSTKNYTSVGGGKYIWYCYPEAWGALPGELITLGPSQVPFNVTTNSFTNAYGHASSYLYYVSPYPYAGGFTVEVP